MDEVEGRKTTAVDVGSYPTMNCNTCPGVKATAFCVHCHEYLCTDCTGYHQRLKLTKTHTLLTGGKFPSESPPTRQDKQADVNEKCHEHPKEDIRYYCERHCALCCNVCNVLSHEQCTKTYVSDIAEDFRSGPELKKLNNDIFYYEKMIVKSMADVDECLKAVETLNVGEMEILRQYKANIIEYLDRREEELQTEMQQYHDEDVAVLKELQEKLNTCQSVLNDMKEKLKLHENNATELFIAAKRMVVQVTKLQSSLQKMKIGFRRYSIVKNSRMETVLHDKTGVAGVVEIVGTLC